MSGLVRIVAGLSLFIAAAATADHPEADQSRARQYHEILRSNPEPGYLFDRFYNTWLDHGSVDELQAFMEAQVEQTDATADRLLLAFFYLKQNEPTRTQRILEQALAESPDNVAAWYHLARLRMQTLDFATAIEHLETARELESTGELAIDIAKLQGQLYARTSQPDKARVVWSELLEDEAADDYLYEDLIDLQVEEGLHDEALATATTLIERTQDPYQRVIRQLRMGDIHQRAGRQAEALAVYAGALADVGGGSWIEQEIYAQIEQVFRREEDLAGLQEHYTSLLAEHDQRVTLRVQYARLLAELNEAEKAVEQWQQVLELTPGERDHREAYVDLLAEAGQHEQAVTQLEQLIARHGDDLELQIRLAELQHEAEQPEAAAQTLLAYLEQSDQSPFAYHRTARLLERFEQPDEAATVYDRLRAAHPDDPSAPRAHAEFLYRIERKDDALAIWSELADAANETELLNIARALGGRGEHEAAFAVLYGRFDAFADEPAYLAALCQQALRLERHAEALPWARRRLVLLTDDRQFESALGDAVQMAIRGEQLDALVAELQDMADRSVAETCLLTELLERRGQGAVADELLAAAEADANAADQTRRLLRQRARLYQQRRDWLAAAEVIERLIEQAVVRPATFAN